MKIRLLKSARVQVPAGTVVEMPDSQALLLVKTGAAARYEEPKPVEQAVKAPTEKAAKKAPARRKKKEE